MVSWKIQDMIKRGILRHKVNDEVVVFYRKKNGYPRALKDDVIYYVNSILPDGHIFLSTNRKSGKIQTKLIKVHGKYVVNKSALRDIKLNSILSKTNSSEEI